ncbi:hypothetical protein HMPREF0673_02280 [Leyella stercorea DSM 18206]|uniref:Uncharacterized protein n=1 Tax=Leyella stercorea DSM 18206 TaxID=1002367 RepID=G6B063_9BACT|nr:hypothetical protein HMPREF0673_02280 [Leyella stercorea DSM 18206]
MLNALIVQQYSIDINIKCTKLIIISQKICFYLLIFETLIRKIRKKSALLGGYVIYL